ncbi:MAG: type II toxin-antitoxin system HicB family antitoxin [Spirochaetaceae bacterium]|jgi:predicted RNase H-like HicB family nuclease|nr:type II toxin-antitoxin system HicB family antitoxin [Spirochaetaceae bacterium]
MDKEIYKYHASAFPITCADGTISYGAEFTEIDGCVGGGDTPDEAIREAYENLEVHLEVMREKGLTIPQPATNYGGKIVLNTSKTTRQKAVELARADEMNC